VITVDEIKARIERPLTSDEERVLPAWIVEAEDKIRRYVRDLDVRMALVESAPRHLSVTTVKTVLARMIERKLRNANGYRQISADGAQITVDQELSAGKIYLSDEDRADLAPTPVTGFQYPGAFSLQVGI